jgi:DNA modification methylase
MMEGINGQVIEYWPLDQLFNCENNPRTHSEEQIDQILSSIKEFDFVGAILIDPKGVIIAGHGRVAAARKLGMTEIPAIVVSHLSAAKRHALMIADNKIAENAGWDEAKLRAVLKEVDDESILKSIGFDDQELARLLAQEVEGLTDEDSIPELPAVPVSSTGDCWRMGDHILLMGDATSVEAVASLMGGYSAQLIFADFPYNVDYEGYTEDALKMQGDRMTREEYCKFLAGAFRCFRGILKPDGSLYVCHASSWQREVQNSMEAAGFETRCQIIWAKNTFAWGFGRFKHQHEPIFYGHLAGQKDAWYGDKSQSTLWTEDKPAANRLHPTSKPTGLVERALLNSSRAGDVVADLFAGSGTTLIACEKLRRKAYLMEIDPRYADCIVRRYQDYSGKPAVLVGDGRTFEEVAGERSGEAL